MPSCHHSTEPTQRQCPQVEHQYKGNMTQDAAPPHVFAVANRAYEALLLTKLPQCFVVSGEVSARHQQHPCISSPSSFLAFLGRPTYTYILFVSSTHAALFHFLHLGCLFYTCFITVALRHHFHLPRDAAQQSGAGKSETTKLLVHHLMDLCKSGNTKLEEQIVQVQPMLEAFGNAKTVMNNNSSRFGKYLELTFQESGAVTGGMYHR